jgi:hypothetical protein
VFLTTDQAEADLAAKSRKRVRLLMKAFTAPIGATHRSKAGRMILRLFAAIATRFVRGQKSVVRLAGDRSLSI